MSLNQVHFQYKSFAKSYPPIGYKNTYYICINLSDTKAAFQAIWSTLSPKQTLISHLSEHTFKIMMRDSNFHIFMDTVSNLFVIRSFIICQY